MEFFILVAVVMVLNVLGFMYRQRAQARSTQSHYENLLPGVDTPHHFRHMPLRGTPEFDGLVESMRGHVASVGYNRDVVSDVRFKSRRHGRGNKDRSQEEAECFVVDRYGASHTLLMHIRDEPIKGYLLEDHAEHLADELGVDLVRF